jgi:hypothetical protein
MLRYLGLALLLAWASAPAAAPPQSNAPPPPPPMPDQADDESIIKPEVTIIQQGEQIVEEYRINGQLYKVKVIPKVGKPYYLLYPQGAQGQPVRRELGELQTPFWVIFSW